MNGPTGAERYFEERLRDAEYADAHKKARQRIDTIDSLIRALDRRRADLELSKAELARRAGLQPEAVRRLFSNGAHNPTLSTISALAAALDAELVIRERATRARGGRERTRRRTA